MNTKLREAPSVRKTIFEHAPDSHGALDYLGRLDHQVKLRGFRIEFGDIESALLLHTGVKQAVVTVWERNKSERRLVAYVVPRVTGEVETDVWPDVARVTPSRCRRGRATAPTCQLSS